MSLVRTLFDIALPVSAAVQPRTPQKVYLHLLSELGELAEEANIAAGELYKEAGPDGVLGEAADVMNCLADLLWITTPDKDLLEEACNEIAHLADLDDFDSNEGWPPFAFAKDDFAGATVNIHIPYGLTQEAFTLQDGHARMILAEMTRAILVLVKASNPLVTEREFINAYRAKCEKWREKAS